MCECRIWVSSDVKESIVFEHLTHVPSVSNWKDQGTRDSCRMHGARFPHLSRRP